MTDTTVAQRSAQLRDGRTATILRPAEITARQRGGGARTLPMVSQQVGAKHFLGVPPTFRIADRIGSASERNRGVGTKIREIQARVP